jgi:pyruvate kinase
MDRIIARVERDEDWRHGLDAKRPEPEKSSADALSAAAVQVAHTIGARAIVAFTQSGSTALRVAREKPDCPVLGLTTRVETSRRLALVWGVHASLTTEVHSMTEAVESALKTAQREGFAQKGDEIVVVAGVPFGQPGTTNALRVASL